MSEKKTEDKRKFKEPRDVRLPPGRMQPQEYARNLWVITVEDGTTMEDIQKPGFWAAVAVNMKAYDRIEVRCDNDSFFAELLVRRADRTSATVRMLNYVDLEKKDDKVTTENNTIDTDDYEYKFRGPQKRHSIVRKSDNAVMVENMDSKEAALSWLATYLSESRAA